MLHNTVASQTMVGASGDFGSRFPAAIDPAEIGVWLGMYGTSFAIGYRHYHQQVVITNGY
jgi:hypothetical protein